jgi:CBS domain-containing protein
MKTLQHILDEKGAEVFSVAPDDTILDAIKAMADHDIGALVVLDREMLVGIVTERHYARRVFLKGKSSPKTQVKDIMTTPVVCADSSHQQIRVWP